MKNFVFTLFLVLTSASIVNSQDIPSNIDGKELPYTWEMPMFNGKMVSTLHENGTITTVMLTGCISCNSYGMCQVCKGTGGQFWYGIGILPCGSCGGSGMCASCGGKGYSVINTTTSSSGLTIGYDEHGNYYVACDSRINGKTRNSYDDGYYHCCDKGVTTFGMDLYHKCKNCGVVHKIGIHMCKKR